MKNIYTLAILLILAAVIPVYAQNIRITGRVTDRTSGAPLPGAVVSVPGTTRATSTDTKGAYSINIPSGTKLLVFSMMTHESDTVRIGTRTKIDVALAEKSLQMEEVVVNAGYGTMRKSDISGSVASIQISETDAMATQTLDNLLRGKLAGVQVTTTNAAPGGGSMIRIRGTSSLTGNNDPLYVVDGVVLTPSEDLMNVFTGSDAQGSQNSLLGIDPSDIASMEVLKDASATAIYGSLGANGVILITTKNGASRRPRVEVSSSVSVSTVSRKLDYLSFDEFLNYKKEVGKYEESNYYDENHNLIVQPMDWQDYCTRNAISQNYKVNISGSNENTTYYISGGWSDQNGVIKETNASTASFRVNLDRKISDHVKIGTKTSFSYTNNNMTQGTEATGNPNASLIRAMLSYRPYAGGSTVGDDEDETISSGSPIGWLYDYKDLSTSYRIIPSAYLDVKFNDAFSYKLSIGGDYVNSSRSRYYGNLTFPGANVNGKAGTSMSFARVRYTIDNTLNYNALLGEKHRINAMIGTSFSSTITPNSAISTQNFPDQTYQLDAINSGLLSEGYRYNVSTFNLLSFMGRIVYSYKDRYVTTVSFRADGSSKFAKGNRYGYFPAFSVAWRINQENFLKNWTPLSDLKLRLGWGVVGNQASSPYQTLGTYVSCLYPNHTNDSMYESGVYRSNFPNKSLKWETTYQYNVGLDVAFLNNRYSLTIDLYDKTSNDLLQSLPISPASGYRSIWVNAGEINNQGLEIALSATPIETRDISLTVNGNIAFNRNKVISLGLPSNYKLGSSVSVGTLNHPVNIYFDGQPIALFWGYEDAGIIQEGETGPKFNGAELGPGSIKFIDHTGDGDVTEEDKVIIGNPNPKFNYGFDLNFRWKQLNFGAVFYGVYGNKIYNANLVREWDVMESRNNNFGHDAFYRAWRPDKPDKFFPALNQFDQVNQPLGRYVEDGSFLRLASLSLSYRIPFKKKAIQSINLTLMAQNVFTITSYSGFDPEINSYGNNMLKYGIDSNSYPNARTYTLGLSLIF